MSRAKPFGDHGPIPVLEGKGLVVVRDPDLDETIDAFSAPLDGHAVAVLTGAPSTSWDRDDFNVAHEFGHCVMHLRAEPGRQSVEDQAHRFAGAFLAPADAIVDELPTTLNWNLYLDLKYKWGLSIAALVRRALDLQVIDGDTYTRAMKHRARYGWRRIEPGHKARPLVKPVLISNSLQQSGLSVDDLADQIGVPTSVIATIVGSS
jgi:Zn-dependent peptidase ImmA (M78 family)